MLKQLILENWKSFRHAVLPIDPLTILIGTNASGKSNALEALEFLRRTAMGKDLQAALAGDDTLDPIRGGVEWATFQPETRFTLKVLVQGRNDSTDYLYSITVETIHSSVQLYDESLAWVNKNPKTGETSNEKKLFYTNTLSSDSPNITAHIYYTESVKKVEFSRTQSILSQVKGLSMDFFEGVNIVSQTLKNIFILEPAPAKMRYYSPLSDRLQRDAANIAGVLAALTDNKKTELKSTVTTYVKHLPERDIQKVWAEPVGIFGKDAMLYCEELWIPDQPPKIIDARSMSDGTLRFLGIMTAILTRPPGSQIVIEEVDNGLHPSRSDLLLKMLVKIGEERKIDILVTTHNPALLDALDSEMLPFVVVAHRDAQTGESKLTLLENVDNFPKLFASGSLGKLTAKGSIERSLSHNKEV